MENKIELKPCPFCGRIPQVRALKILMRKGKDRLRLSDVINEIELMEKFDVDFTGNWKLAENPPNDNNYVLLSFNNFSIPLVGRYEEDDEGGAYYVADDDEPCTASDLYVNAWMPLPAPYRM